MYLESNIEARSCNSFWIGKAIIIITYSECVFVALGSQHAMRMGCIILSSVACLVAPYFSTLSHKRHNFLARVIEHEICVFIFSDIFCETFLFLRRNRRDITINVHKSSCTVKVFLVRF